MTRQESVALADAGLIDPQRYELIEGDLVEKERKYVPYLRPQVFLSVWLKDNFDPTFVVPVPGIDVSPADMPTSWPEPDLVLLNQSLLGLVDSIKPENVVLVVEISDATHLDFDLGTKAGLYARAAIPEYWVVDINARRLVVHRDPADGRYQSIVAYAENESISCLAAPDALRRVADLL